MKNVAPLTCALAVLLAAQAAAQEPAPARFAPETVAAAFQPRMAPAPRPAPAPVPLLAAAPEAAPAAAPRISRRTRSLLQTGGGALVGAWLGYFAAQVVRSDWDKQTDAEVLQQRATFALGGAVFGGASGMLFLGGRGPSAPVAARPQQEPRGANEVITREQVEGASAASVHDLVQRLRPEWLRTRGNNSFSEGGKVWTTGEMGSADRGYNIVVVPGSDAIVAYLDNARLGGPETLRQISAANVQRVEFISAGEATYRWGINHSHGAILVTTIK
jgi:hypothetical protein